MAKEKFIEEDREKEPIQLENAPENDAEMVGSVASAENHQKTCSSNSKFF